MKVYISILLVTCSTSYLSNVVGFVETASRHPPRTSLKLSPEEERAAVLSDYLVKAHTQKLEAIQRVEKAKDAEIKALQEQLAEAKTGALVSVAQPSTPAAATSDELASLSKEDLIAKVLSAQQFMAKYIVDAQEQKVKAIAAAEQAMAKKFAEATPAIAASKEPTAIVEPKESTLSQKRNAKVVAAAAAGKSRWGEKELQRVTKESPVSTTTAAIKSAPVEAVITTAVNGVSIEADVPPEVEAADHGLRNDGGVGGPSLAARVAAGTDTFEGSPSEAPLAALSPKQLLFQKRNARLALAAKAGKSRWGEQEMEKIQLAASAVPINGASAPSPLTAAEVPVPPEVAAADHGMRNDGGVGGPSLAQRINLGAQLIQGN